MLPSLRINLSRKHSNKDTKKVVSSINNLTNQSEKGTERGGRYYTCLIFHLL